MDDYKTIGRVINRPLISVVMSIYNEPLEWLQLSIDSILEQTYDEFEFIIVCDNPDYKDGINLLKGYSGKDSRIKIVYNSNNLGLTKSLNKAISLALGDYIVRMDADDIAFPNRLRKQIDFMTQHPLCVASGGFAKIIDEKGKVLGDWRIGCTWMELKSGALFTSPILHPTAIFRRIINGAAIRYDETKRYAQDYALWATLIDKHELLNTGEQLIFYRQTSKQVSNSHHEEQTESAVSTQELLFEKLKLYETHEIKRAISIITKKQLVKVEVKDLSIQLIDFLNKNQLNSNIDIKIVRKYILTYFCLYLPYHLGMFKSLRYALSFSWSINFFQLRPFLAMSYHCLKNRSK